MVFSDSGEEFAQWEQSFSLWSLQGSFVVERKERMKKMKSESGRIVIMPLDQTGLVPTSKK